MSEFKGGAEECLKDMIANPAIVPLLVVPGEGPISDWGRAKGLAVEIVSFGVVSDIRRPITLAQVFRAVVDWAAAANNLSAIVKSRGIDLVHSNGMKAHCVAILARAFGTFSLVCHVHDLPLTRFEQTIWRLISIAASHVIVVSRPCWPALKLPQNVSVVHNGIKVEFRAPTYRANNRPLFLGFCGRIHPFKGLHHLISWMAAEKMQQMDLKLIVRGEAAPEHALYLEGLKRHIAEQNLSERVEFQGKVTGIYAVYDGLDVVVVPSSVPDPLPRSVMEAMALGIPVIGYPAGGIPHMIDDGIDGWLVSNSDEFANVIGRLKANDQLATAIGLAARRKTESYFSLSKLYHELNRIYQLV